MINSDCINMKPEFTSVLIVEDDPTLRELVSYDFKRKKFNVLEAANGRDALAIVKMCKVDVIISDICMNGGGGMEFLSELRAIDPQLPALIFITGYADVSAEEAIRRGAHAVFQKPFQRKEVFNEVYKLIGFEEGRES